MKLNIYSLTQVLYHGDVSAVNCKTSAGEITVLNNHRPLIATLPAGVVKVTDTEAKDHYFNISSGFLEVQETHTMRLLVDQQ
jgi:F-type H+-transporting ATPase subunit epsilon